MTNNGIKSVTQLEHFRQKRFSLLFMRFFLVIFLCFAICFSMIQVISYMDIRPLMDNELDEANLRSLSKVQAVMDSVRLKTLSTLLRLSSEDATSFFLGCPPESINGYRDVDNRIKLKTQLESYTAANYFSVIFVYSRVNERVIENNYGSTDLPRYPNNQAIYAAQDINFTNNDVAYLLRNSISLHMAAPKRCLTMLVNVDSGYSRSGLIGVDFELDTLNKLIYNARMDAFSDILMLDSSGLVLLDTSDKMLNQPFSSFLADQQLYARMLSEETGVATAHVNSRMVRVSWMHSTMDQMCYLQLIPYEHHTVLLNHLLDTTLIVLAVGLIVALILSYLLACYMHRPIKLLTRLVDAPASIENPEYFDDEIRYILMSLMTTNEKNVQLEQKSLQQYEALRHAQANVLQSQMTPHFLYNTLQSIHMMVLLETGNPQSQAAQAVLTLSSIAHSIMKKGVDVLSLAEELDYLNQYIFLKKLSYSDKLHVDIRIPEELGGASVPKLCLQPLLENAIRYGMRDDADCLIEITASQSEDGVLTIVMDDNGAGIAEKQMEEFNQLANQDVIFCSQHVGLINLGQRLNLLYGSQARLILSRSRLGGLRVSFSVPQGEEEK